MDVTIAQVLSSVWMQGGLVALALGSIGYDKSDALKAIPAKLSAWWTARRAGKTVTETPTQRTACENRRTTLVGIRHKSSELPAGEEREKALTLCDEMDKLAARLWPEAA
jgi:hypothetical protein